MNTPEEQNPQNTGQDFILKAIPGHEGEIELDGPNKTIIDFAVRKANTTGKVVIDWFSSDEFAMSAESGSTEMNEGGILHIVDGKLALVEKKEQEIFIAGTDSSKTYKKYAAGIGIGALATTATVIAIRSMLKHRKD